MLQCLSIRMGAFARIVGAGRRNDDGPSLLHLASAECLKRHFCTASELCRCCKCETKHIERIIDIVHMAGHHHLRGLMACESIISAPCRAFLLQCTGNRSERARHSMPVPASNIGAPSGSFGVHNACINLRGVKSSYSEGSEIEGICRQAACCK